VDPRRPQNRGERDPKERREKLTTFDKNSDPAPRSGDLNKAKQETLPLAGARKKKEGRQKRPALDPTKHGFREGEAVATAEEREEIIPPDTNTIFADERGPGGKKGQESHLPCLWPRESGASSLEKKHTDASWNGMILARQRFTSFGNRDQAAAELTGNTKKKKRSGARPSASSMVKRCGDEGRTVYLEPQIKTVNLSPTVSGALVYRSKGGQHARGVYQRSIGVLCFRGIPMFRGKRWPDVFLYGQRSNAGGNEKNYGPPRSG